MNNIIAVCDREAEYAHRLMEYMNRKKSFFMKAAAFTDEKSIVEFFENNKIEFLLISEKMLNEKTNSIRAKQRALLIEDQHSSSHSGLKKIYKYQSAEKIVKEVMSLYDAEKLVLDPDESWRRKKKIIGVYTPVGGARKTSFALALALILSQKTAVLYINLESFSGLEKILGITYENGFGDLLYYARHSKCGFISKLPTVTTTVQNMDIIPPAQCPDDLRQLEIADLLDIFTIILSKTEYETLIIDIGNEIRGIDELLEFCSVVYVPVREDPLSRAKIYDFDEYIKGRITKAKKIQKIRLPYNTASVLGSQYHENLIYSELGDFVRELIQKGETVE